MSENEAPLSRWLGAALFALVAGGIMGSLISVVMAFIPFFDDGMFLAPFKDFFETVIPFTGLFLGCFLGLRWICRTSLRAFFFGAGRKPDIKTALIAGALMFAGIIAGAIPDIKYIVIYTRDIKLIMTNLVLCLLFVWIQTTTEEIFFRGFFLRAPYGNRVPVLPRGLLAASISSLLFMIVHLANPEVRSLAPGADLILGAATYFASAFCMYICNLLIGGMEASLVFHFINNFYCFFLFRMKVSAVDSPAIFMDNAGSTVGILSFFQELLMFIPPMIYLIWVRRHKTHEFVDYSG